MEGFVPTEGKIVSINFLYLRNFVLVQVVQERISLSNG